METINQTFNRIVELTKANPTSTGGQHSGLCPAHNDRSPSLSLTLTEDRILINCHSGCSIDQICNCLRIRKSDLFRKCETNTGNKITPNKKKNANQVNPNGKVRFFSSKHKKWVTENSRYTYQKVDGSDAFYVIRAEPKDFRPMTTDGRLSLEGVGRVPYRLPELLQGIKDSKPILFLEGEKDADRVAEMGFVASTFVGGTGKWRDEYLEYFRDADIVLVPDNDQPGIKGMQDIAEQLHGTAKNIKVLELPGLGERKEKHGKDFSDWADIDGNDQKKLNEFISDAPEWSPLEVYDENLAVVEELNLKHFVTMIGGKTTVVNEVHDPAMERNILTYSTPTDFKNYYSNKFITIDDRPVSIGHHWFKHPLRRQFPGITFMPGETSPYMGNYNLWEGFNVSPKAFNPTEPDNVQGFSIFWDHIINNIANGNDKSAMYVIGWMADMVQHPRKRLGVSLVLRSDEQGTGKGLFAKIFGHLFGKHYLHVTNPRHLTGNFNAHLIDCLLLFADEAFWAGDKSAEGALKTLITEELRAVEIKGKDVFQARNFTRLLIASNKSWVVPSELHDRRFVILDVNPQRKRDTDYFGKMIKQMESGGYEALLWFLLNLEIKVDLRNCMPNTSAMRDSKVQSMSPVQSFWYECLVEGMFGTDQNWEGPHTKTFIYMLFREQSRKNEHFSKEVFAKELKKLVALEETRPRKERCWRFPPLEECRNHFEEKYGIKITEPG